MIKKIRRTVFALLLTVIISAVPAAAVCAGEADEFDPKLTGIIDLFEPGSMDQRIYTATLSKIPASFSVDINKNNLLIKDAMEDEELAESLSRGDLTADEARDLFTNDDTEAILFPAEYTAGDTPYYMFVFVTDGYTNRSSRLKSLGAQGIEYLFGILQTYYTEEEQPEYSAAELGNERYIICDRVPTEDSNQYYSYIKDYYNVWNGDLVQVMLKCSDGYEDEAVAWAEDFLMTWEDAE